MLKDKIENDNYTELCEKACKFITNGVVLPLQEKDQFAEVMKNLTSSLTQAMQNDGNIVKSLPKPQTNDKEDKLKELAEKYKGKHITYSEKPCYICGYSVDFDCLIAGTDYDIGKSINIDDADYIIVSPRFANYFYVPKDIVKE
jgi:hypothetical protein